MRYMIMKVLWVVLLVQGSCAMANPVMTQSGPIQGEQHNGINVYRGIPFASPPVGALRWQEPVPVKPWTGVLNAKSFAPSCMQKGVSMPGETAPVISEDCLYLNIWAPKNTKLTGLPVMVWIHGGAYKNGAASMKLYHGDQLARQGIIFVSISYRLGVFGFLAHPELTKESTNGSSGNYGLMDQIAALEWIKNNISAFGGDPSRVTIAGQSAGAMSVSALIASPRAKGLFHKAIGQSGGIFEPIQLAPHYLLKNAEIDGVKFATSLGADSLKALRGLPAEALLADSAERVSHPVIEPSILPMTPYDAYARGLQNNVPLLIGSNSEEARSLVDVKGTTAKTFAADIERSVGALPPQLLAAYPFTNDSEAREAHLGLERDLRFGWDMWAWARLHAAAGKNKVFFYSFKQRPPFPTASLYADWGASHFSELWYMFNHLNQERWKWSRADHKLAHDMSHYWVNFAKSGNPNGGGLTRWPEFTISNNDVMYFENSSYVGRVANLQSLNVFDSVYSSVRGAQFGVFSNE